MAKEDLGNMKNNWSEQFELNEEIDDVKIIKNQIADYTDKSNKLEDLNLVF